MRTPAPADLQRWSDEVARDPRSLAFLPLARTYRRQGLRDAALNLCVRGLEAYPEHIEAHGLLALLYLESGDHQKAADEWSIVLRLDPDNFDALRGMGFYCFERDQLSRARELLERAVAQRPNDVTVRELLHELGTRDELRQGTSRPAPAVQETWAFEEAASLAMTQPASATATDAAVIEQEDVNDEPAPAPPPPLVAPPPLAAPRQLVFESVEATRPPAAPDPAALFDALLDSGPLLGALLVDAQGFVLAGRLKSDAAADAATLGAELGSAVIEAARTTAHLRLGDWRGVTIEAELALLHVKPVPGEHALVIAAARNAPPGWLLRAAAHAAEQAARYVEDFA